jgi:hypothetical protein
MLLLLLIRGIGRWRLLPRLERDVHLLDAAQVRHAVCVEAAGEKRARGVAAREEVIRAAGAVGQGADADVVDCAVEGKVDGLCGVGAIVGFEFFVGEGNGAVLRDLVPRFDGNGGGDWGLAYKDVLPFPRARPPWVVAPGQARAAGGEVGERAAEEQDPAQYTQAIQHGEP